MPIPHPRNLSYTLLGNCASIALTTIFAQKNGAMCMLMSLLELGSGNANEGTLLTHMYTHCSTSNDAFIRN